METPTIVPLTNIDALRRLVGYPETVDAWRWAYRRRHERGLDGAFIRQGRRILVDVPRYLDLVRSNGGAA